MIRRIAALILAFSATLLPLAAAQFQSDELGVTIHLPDAAGWQNVPEATTATARVLAAATHQPTATMVGITLQTGLAGKALTDPAVPATIKKDLGALGFQIFGHSTINLAGRTWLQFPVNANGTRGFVRATAANGNVFTISALRGDGKDPLTDSEVVRTLASIKFSAPAGAAAPAPVAGTQPAGAPASADTAAASPKGTEAAPATGTSDGPDYKRIGIAAGVLFVLLLLVWGMLYRKP